MIDELSPDPMPIENVLVHVTALGAESVHMGIGIQLSAPLDTAGRLLLVGVVVKGFDDDHGGRAWEIEPGSEDLCGRDEDKMFGPGV
jgi:hypothetical protein